MNKLTETITPYLEYSRNYFKQLSVRDQRALIVLSPFLVIIFAYFLIGQPLVNWSTRQRVDYVYEKETHALMVAKQDQARAGVSVSKSPVSTKNAVSVIGSSSRRIGLNLARVQPTKQGVSVWIDAAPYQKLLDWLIQLHEQEHMQIHQIRIDRTEQSGVVKVVMRLSY
ncbi:MAG: type II secretion system protein M [Endozoicomonadaceae bacterium]|nr:type II secretion system protein M [Endozoicomonadaceae bacterium]